MSFWPWRSRPVVTPFMDDYSGRVLTFPGTFAAAVFPISIPDNLYIMPSCISIPFNTGAGIRSTTPSTCRMIRGNIPFAASLFGTVQNGQNGTIFLADYGDDYAVAGAVTVRCYQLPRPIFLYPADRIEFHFPSAVAADVIGPISIHGKFWEVH